MQTPTSPSRTLSEDRFTNQRHAYYVQQGERWLGQIALFALKPIKSPQGLRCLDRKLHEGIIISVAFEGLAEPGRVPEYTLEVKSPVTGRTATISVIDQVLDIYPKGKAPCSYGR